MSKTTIRRLSIMLVLTVVFGILLALYLRSAGMVPGAENAAQYTSVQKGAYSDITVTVLIDASGKVISVKADVSGETDRYGQVAGPQICAAIEQAGTYEGVDAVSGSTLTSDAILAAVKDCMQQAGVA